MLAKELLFSPVQELDARNKELKVIAVQTFQNRISRKSS